MTLSRQLQGASFLMVALLTLVLGACDATTTTPPSTAMSATPSLVLPTWTPISPSVSQTLEGMTVGVQPLHADAHRISLAISVDGPAKPHPYGVQWYSGGDPYGSPTLSVGDKVLTWMESTSWPLGTAALPGEQLHGQSTLVFDASGLGPISATLPLRLLIPLYIDDTPRFLPESLPTSVVPVTDTPTPLPTPTLPASVLWFDLSMTMAFDSRETIVQVGQTVESNDVAVTLEQLEITPSEARVMLRYSPTKPNTFLKGVEWEAKGSLDIVSGSGNSPITLLENPEDEEYPTDRGCHSSPSNNPCFLNYLDPPFPGPNPIDCTLTFTAYSSSPNQGPWPAPPPLGTWVFHFTIPAASK